MTEAQKNPAASGRKEISVLATILMLIVGLSVTFILAVREKQAVHSRSRDAAQLHVQSVKAAMELSLACHSAVCDSVAAFFAASEFVSRDEFQTFTRHLIEQASKAQTIEWVDYVRAEDRDAWSAKRGMQIREQGDAETFRDATAKDFHAPVVYVEPEDENAAALGYDLASEASRRQALLRSVQMNRCAATAPILLVQSDHRMVLMATPVFLPHARAPGVERGLDDTQGWAVALFDISKIYAQFEASPLMAFSLTDVTDPDQHVDLFSERRDQRLEPVKSAQFVEELQMFGRRWRMTLGYELESGWQPFRLCGLIGTLITLLLASHFNATRRIYNDQQVLKETHEEIRRRNREIRGFYHSVSHELKTPLASAREFASLIHDGVAGPVSEEQSDFTDFILESCDQMTRYVNDMLDVSRIETGKFTLERTLSRIDDLVKQPACAAQKLAEDKDVRFTKMVDPDLPELLIDGQRIQQALSNLLTNAVKFTRPGGSVQLYVWHSVERDSVVVMVRDTGVGISSEDQRWVFERLRQAPTEDAVIGVDGGGLGLGLAITKEIVDLHGGTIEVESESGVGTTFAIYLPVVLSHDVVIEGDRETVEV